MLQRGVKPFRKPVAYMAFEVPDAEAVKALHTELENSQSIPLGQRFRSNYVVAKQV